MTTTILLITLTTVVTSVLTTAFVNYKHRKMASTIGCPFKNACIHYDEIETKLAAQRVAKLLLENAELYKKTIRAFLEDTSNITPVKESS